MKIINQKKHIKQGTLNYQCWENEGNEGKVLQSFSFNRSYKDKEEWQKTQTLRLQDLTKMRILLKEVYKDLSSKF